MLASRGGELRAPIVPFTVTTHRTEGTEAVAYVIFQRLGLALARWLMGKSVRYQLRLSLIIENHMGEGKQPTSFKLSSGLLVDATAAHLHSKQ